MVTSVSITCQALASLPALWLLGCVLAILIQCLLTLTLVSPQCKEGGFPQELWLGVSADAVSVYKRGEGKPLEVFQYEHILSFGAPLANTYKIVVDERELLFETSEVVDVAKLMKAYISMIVKKRYSITRSVSSQGSSR